MEARDLDCGDEGRHALGGGVFIMDFVVLRIDSDLDSDLSPSDFLALKELESPLLLFLGTDIDEAIAFGATRLTPSTTNDTSRDDGNSGGSEEFGEGSVIDGEAEIGHEEHGLGRFALGGFTDGTSGLVGFGLDSRGLGFLWLGLGRSSRGVCNGTVGGSSLTVFSICLGLFDLALKKGGPNEWK